tara:strand:+ start:34 stop:522 length:489 start_codon:yes stop_codon:yes gene_type:complete
MAVHKHNSWGRTRRPKSLYDDGAVPTRQSATSVTCVAAGDLADALNSGDAGKNGYVTENQRFLHIQIENDGTDDTLQLYAYNYAFGAWAELYLPHGTRIQLDSADGDDSSGQTTNDTYVEAKWTTIDGKFMVTIPINGIDRIAFVHDGSLNDMVVRAACSTF